jgi:hypothetical protein
MKKIAKIKDKANDTVVKIIQLTFLFCNAQISSHLFFSLADFSNSLHYYALKFCEKIKQSYILPKNNYTQQKIFIAYLHNIWYLGKNDLEKFCCSVFPLSNHKKLLTEAAGKFT